MQVNLRFRNVTVRTTSPFLLAFATALLMVAQAVADEYVVTIDEASTRLARVVATVVPEGNTLFMNDEGNQGLAHGWATFVEALRVWDSNGNELLFEPEDNSRWRLLDYSGGPVKIAYTVRLDHDHVPLNFGDNGAAYANSFGVMWSGRALFIAGRPTKDIQVRFELPAKWHLSTPWERKGDSSHTFTPHGTEDFLNSAFFAGTHTQFDLTVGSAAIRFALAGPNVATMRSSLSEMVDKYLRYYNKIYGPAPATQMLLIASDSSYWGGEVMGRVISLSIADQARGGFNPLTVMSHVIAHEVFHLWNSNIEIRAKDYWQFEWFNEGFAEYVSWLAQLRLGDVDEETYLSQLAGDFSKYAARQRSGVSLTTAGKDKVANYDLIYSGGQIAAATLDFDIRRRSGGSKSLDQLWSYLLDRFPRGGDPLTLQKLKGAMRTLYGEEAARDFEAYASSPSMIPFAQAADRFGLASQVDSSGQEMQLSRAPNPTENQNALWVGFRSE